MESTLSVSSSSKVAQSDIKTNLVSFEQSWILSLLTASYILGELSHFLIGVTSRDVARTVHYGDLSCFDHVQADEEGGEGRSLSQQNNPTANESAFLTCSSHRNFSR